MSKLTKEQVQEIVRTPRTRGIMKALAEQYGVSQGRISQIFKANVNAAPELPSKDGNTEGANEVIYELKY